MFSDTPSQNDGLADIHVPEGNVLFVVGTDFVLSQGCASSSTNDRGLTNPHLKKYYSFEIGNTTVVWK